MLIRIMIAILFLAFLTFSTAIGQNDAYLDMSLEEMYDLEVVVSASKKPEDIFEAPLSVTIIKREEILKSGANSIPEALRLAPGVLVREQTPGNFDVHIRGFDNSTVNFILPLPTNTIILVMINNRIVYNYLSGGTFWESLPVGINDVERIEVVRGPASSLYGPNAAAGVINIITQTHEYEGPYSHFRLSTGNNDSRIFNGSLGYNWNDKFSALFSGNYSYRTRYDRKYYDWYQEKYVEIDNLATLLFPGHEAKFSDLEEISLPDTKQSLDRYGLNSFFRYTPEGETEVSLSAGLQKAKSQKSYYNNFSTPLSTHSGNSGYIDFKGNFRGLCGNISYDRGKQNSNIKWNNHEYHTVDYALEYDWERSVFSVRPGINYRRAVYRGRIIRDTSRTDEDEDKIIDAKAFSLLVNYYPVQKIRLIGGLRLDRYNINSKLSTSYQIGATYRLDKRNLFRFTNSKATRSPFMLDSYIHEEFMTIINPDEEYGNFSYTLLYAGFLGNKNMNYMTHELYELGWRTKLSNRVKFDLELFTSKLDNLIDMDLDIKSHEVIDEETVILAGNAFFDNIASSSGRQNGLSLSVTIKAAENLKLNLSGQIQKTKTKFPAENNEKGKTPGYFCGFNFNYTPAVKWNLNLNSYYIPKHKYIGFSFQNNRKSEEVPGFLSLNVKISYAFHENTRLFVSFRNILGKHREYGFTDKIKPAFYAGLQYN